MARPKYMLEPGLSVISGNAHPELAQSIAHELKIDLLNTAVGAFPDGETSTKIKDNVRKQDVFLIQPTGPPVNQNIMEALVMVDALKRADPNRVTVVIPYFGYARQDRKTGSREPITAKLVANLFAAAGVDHLVSVDLHSHQIQGFTDKPFDHLYAAPTMVKVLKEELEKPVVVAPDLGANKMMRGFARRMDTVWAIIDKDRLDANHTSVEAIVGHSVVGRTALIVDDMISTGGSLLKAAEALKERGAKSVVAAVTHGVFSADAVERIESSPHLDRLYVTDSLPGVSSDKIRRISIARLLAQAIKRIHTGESVSVLFEDDKKGTAAE